MVIVKVKPSTHQQALCCDGRENSKGKTTLPV